MRFAFDRAGTTCCSLPVSTTESTRVPSYCDCRSAKARRWRGSSCRTTRERCLGNQTRRTGRGHSHVPHSHQFISLLLYSEAGADSDLLASKLCFEIVKSRESRASGKKLSMEDNEQNESKVPDWTSQTEPTVRFLKHFQSL